MAYKPIIPTLSESGYVDSPESVLSEVLSNYILTDGVQSLLNANDIISLPKTYHQYINSPNEFAEKIAAELEELIGYYFDGAEVVTDVAYPDGPGSTKADVALYATALDHNGVKIGIGKVTRLSDEGLTRVITINNFGDRFKYLGVSNDQLSRRIDQ